MIGISDEHNAGVNRISTLVFFTPCVWTRPRIVPLQTADGKTKKLNSAIRIKGVDIVGKNIIVWSGKKAEVQNHGALCRPYSTRLFFVETTIRLCVFLLVISVGVILAL